MDWKKSDFWARKIKKIEEVAVKIEYGTSKCEIKKLSLLRTSWKESV